MPDAIEDANKLAAILNLRKTAKLAKSAKKQLPEPITEEDKRWEEEAERDDRIYGNM